MNELKFWGQMMSCRFEYDLKSWDEVESILMSNPELLDKFRREVLK